MRCYSILVKAANSASALDIEYYVKAVSEKRAITLALHYTKEKHKDMTPDIVSCDQIGEFLFEIIHDPVLVEPWGYIGIKKKGELKTV